MKTRSGAGFEAVLWILAALTCLPALGQAIAPDTGGTRVGDRELPADEVEAAKHLKELMPFWAATARKYQNYALRFVCTETHRTIDYSRSSNQARKEKETAYGYLLSLNAKNATYDVVRQTLDANGQTTGNEKTIDMECPEPYSWTFMFLPTLASTIRFHYIGREIQNFRLTHVVDFEGSAPREEGKDLREWSGTVWVEENTGNIVRVEARPNFQHDRMLSVWREYQQSFSFIGLHAKGRPHGYIVAVLFDSEREGLLFPSRLDLTDFTWVATDREAMDTRLVLTYDDYRFFYTATKEDVQPAAGGQK